MISDLNRYFVLCSISGICLCSCLRLLRISWICWRVRTEIAKFTSRFNQSFGRFYYFHSCFFFKFDTYSGDSGYSGGGWQSGGGYSGGGYSGGGYSGGGWQSSGGPTKIIKVIEEQGNVKYSIIVISFIQFAHRCI